MREYCQFESFNVTCPENSVILLKTASYGRMRVGHCVQKQYEGPNQPCKADVLHYLDPRCSGRRSCDVPIPELEKIASPCPTDLKSYLEASYECVQVGTGVQQTCVESHQITLNDTTGYLATEVSETQRVGLESCPWSIHVRQGQRVQLELYSFYSTEEINENMFLGPGDCPIYAVVEDGDQNLPISLCEQVPRRGELYTSSGESIKVHFRPATNGDLSNPPKFILRYSAAGCSDIVAPKQSTVSRSGENIVVRCNRTKETWYLTCRGTKWVGEIGNCTRASRRRAGGLFPNSKSVPHSKYTVHTLLCCSKKVVLSSVQYNFHVPLSKYRIQ